MDEIESYLSSIDGETDPMTLEQIRTELLNMSIEDAIECIEQVKHAEAYNSSYIESYKAQEKSWSSIKNTTSHTSVLIYIHNATRDTFSLTHTSWDNSEFPLENYEIAPAGHMSFLLRSAPPKGTARGKTSENSAISHQFTYKSGDYAFKFSTELVLTSKYHPFSFTPDFQPHRQFSTHSIGKNKLLCSTDLEHNLAATPYSYAIAIFIRT